MKKSCRTLLIVGNWKMYKSVAESLDFLEVFDSLLSEKGHDKSVLIYLAVPFTAIKTLADFIGDRSIVIGAQNINDAAEGAFTGEISGKMAREAGAQFVILGHSERRHLFHEDNVFIHKKVKQALVNNLQPILCVGETQAERDEGRTRGVLKRQLEGGLTGISPSHIKNLIIAYEPIWAIGALHAATPEIIGETHLLCREILADLFGQAAESIAIIYGGSVNPDNAQELVEQINVDGLLVGAASLAAESFAKIVSLAQNITVNRD